MRFVLIALCIFSAYLYPGDFSTLADNTWTRIADAPGDAVGRDVPPGRGSTWVFAPNIGKFLRYGGYTPGLSNVLDQFDPATKSWTRLTAWDETYPTDRPGGGAAWMMAYDSTRGLVWMAGGKSTCETGDLGVWSYNPLTGAFAKSGNALDYGSYCAFDRDRSLIVASPGLTCYGGPSHRTDVFDLAASQWESRVCDTLPQECYSGNYPCIYDPSISRVVLLAGADTWHYDPVGNRWEKVTVTGTPLNLKMAAMAYDPENQVIVRYGGSDGRNIGSCTNETYVYKGSTRTWTRLSCPGIPAHAQSTGNQPVFYHLAIDYYPANRCVVMCDPDLGVWAFRYNPAAAMGTTVVDAESVVVGAAAKKAPAPGPADVLRSLPSALNPRFLDLGDDSLTLVTGASFSGDEVSWDYDTDMGVIVKYGGCGNGTNPFYGGYGSSMGVFDPGTETWFARRVSDPGGMDRPGTGCTRSSIYDTNHKKWWFFGNISGEPYPCYPPDGIGPYSYDFSADTFYDHKTDGRGPGGTNLAFDPVHNITIKPDSGSILVFSFDSVKWSTVPVEGGPGRIDGYASTEWVPTLNAFLTFRHGKTWAYYPDSNKWVDLNPSNPPPARECKMGFAYDSRNDIVLLAGGYLVWNENPVKDMWAYHPSTNSWESLDPTPVSGWFGSHYAGLQQTAYDSRHNVFFIQYESGNSMYAYRYKAVDMDASPLKTPKAENPLSIAPNPARSITVFSVKGPVASLRIYDLRGKLVRDMTGEINRGRAAWSVQGAAAGIYLAVAEMGGKRVSRRLAVLR